MLNIVLIHHTARVHGALIPGVREKSVTGHNGPSESDYTSSCMHKAQNRRHFSDRANPTRRSKQPAVADRVQAKAVCDHCVKKHTFMQHHPTLPARTRPPSPSKQTLEHPSPQVSTHTDLLFDFLKEDRKRLLQRFADLSPRSIQRGAGHRRFVYIPGTRSDRVLLVAHADTVWERRKNVQPRLSATGKEICSANTDVGIGADDRAGCAMLWALRDLGHSLLVTSGEEIGCVSSRWLMESPQLAKLAREINTTHRFAVEFDLEGRDRFKCYTVGTPEFRAYCAAQTGFVDAGNRSSTDIVVLCRDFCGVNLSVGYYESHTEEETIRIDDWIYTLEIARKWLSSAALPPFAIAAELQ